VWKNWSALRETWQNTEPGIKLIVWVTVLAILIAVSWYFVARLRDRSDQTQRTTSDMLTNFGQMREQGSLSEEKYRTIKARLSEQLQKELNVDDDKG
jgi:hypothetical protein